MKTSSLILALLLLITHVGTTQKLQLDTSSYRKWPSLENPSISNDGRYVMYTIKNEPLNSFSLVVKSTNGKWEIKYPGIQFGTFSVSSTIACLSQPAGESILLDLKEKKERRFSGRFISLRNIIIYRSNLKPDKIIIENLISRKRDSIDNIKDYEYVHGAKGLILIQSPKDKSHLLSYIWYDLSTQTKIKFGEGTNIRNIILSSDRNKIGYISENIAVSKIQICTYQYPDRKAKVIFEQKESDSLRLVNLKMFCANNANILLEMKSTKIATPAFKNLNIWSYIDSELPPRHHLTTSNFIHAILSTGDLNKLMILSYENETLEVLNKNGGCGWARIVNYIPSKGTESPRVDVFAISLVDGSRIRVDERFSVSPDEKFFLYFNHQEQDFYTYEILTGVIRNVSKNINADWQYLYRGCAGWFENDAAIVIYDKYDIWKIDPLGKQSSINLTNNYGQKNKIQFSFMINKFETNRFKNNTQKNLIAFNTENKENGFFKLTFGKNYDPEKLFMGPFVFEVPDNEPNVNGFMPLKALGAKGYLIKRMRVDQSPNYFWTTDFKNFTTLSSIYPEKKYYWLMSELHTYNKLKNNKGILYKPENFDSSKKYPVIITYYQLMSDRLNTYLEPGYSTSRINIPMFVCKDYLVFCPDIKYRKGYTGESALECVTDAANYLQNISYIDKQKIGIAGHSFGGFETNYIITHTNIFKAAYSGAGVSDLLSYYGGLRDGNIRHSIVENGQYRIASSLWENKDLYIMNSPIFLADKVTTPILFMHGSKDEAVPFGQVVEFFAALKRFNKAAWLLEYIQAGHFLSTYDDQSDFNIRLQQFFDYNLKDSICPRWMLDKQPNWK